MGMRFLQNISALGLLCLLLMACGADGSVADGVGGETAVSPQVATANALSTAIVASSEPRLDFSQISQDIDQAEALWQSQNIAKYSYEMRYRQPGWNMQRLLITVDQGMISDVSHTCFPEQDCILKEIDPETMLIDLLYDTARSVVALEDMQTEITFNQTYGYPNAIIYEDATFVLSAFTVLDE